MTSREWLLFGVALATYIALTWRNLIINMWPTLTGRKWVPIALSVFGLVAIGCVGWLGYWIFNNPDIQEIVGPFVPGLVAILVATKLALAMIVLATICRLGLNSAGELKTAIVAWVSIVALVLAILSVSSAPTLYMVSAVVLLVPFARLAGAQIAMHYNRHR